MSAAVDLRVPARDPFRIVGPAAISFSGGRTSGYMLRRILDAHGGALPDDVHVIFANTGKERGETLDFVRDCAARWGVAITWLEYDRELVASARDAGACITRVVAREVDHATASRDGRPFARLIASRSYLPNPVTRFCTVELKIRTMHRWLRARGYDEWTQAVGLRADEPRRVAKILAGHETGAETVACPLATAGVTQADVLAFWGAQPFDLALRPWEGNCDLCFLKGQSKRVRVMQDRPDLAAWWIAQEQRMGAKFRASGPDYARLFDRSARQTSLPMFGDDPTELDACACTD